MTNTVMQENCLLDKGLWWVMVRNLRPGDKWVPGTIIERTGLLSYVVQVKPGNVT